MVEINLVKINLGCGLSVVGGWLNFDGSPTVRLQRLPVVGAVFKRVVGPKFPDLVKYGDVVAGLPMDSQSVDLVYSSHMLEHLSLEDLKLALAEIKRVLKPGGVFRAVLPDLAVSIDEYINNDKASAGTQFLKDTILGIERRPNGISGKLRSLLGNSNHLWMWDYKGIQEELNLAGFSNISRCYYNDSGVPDFSEVEDADRWHNCLGFECQAPIV